MFPSQTEPAAVNTSFSSQRSVAGQDERPYMNLSEVRQGLSTECNKWGSSVVSELHKAISSTGDGEQHVNSTSSTVCMAMMA